MHFSHLHNHTMFSLLDGASHIEKLFKKAQKDQMPAVAITDHGNMLGAFEFVSKATKYGIKPIVGCEFYVVENRFQKEFTKEKKDKRFHQILLAKNKVGYQNLIKLCSLGYIEGLYSKYPRIDKELIEKYHEGLIATTCCLGAMVPQAILKKGETEAEKEFLWWKDLFQEDYYIELQRHGIKEQDLVNESLLKFSKKYTTKIFASNDSHYVEQEDWVAHDILLCVNTGEKRSTPTMKDFSEDEGNSKGKRFAFNNDQFFFKTTAQMLETFADLPEAIDNTNEIVGKIEHLNLRQDILLPNFPIPNGFAIHQDNVLNQWEYLKHLTYEGAKKRYSDLTADIQERIDFELYTIKTMGYAGYFLIVQDFINEGKRIGVMVGPGRGSAAGSVVAYCVGITNIDPIKYQLLFERFLNPDRKSMPDIDTDFDDEGRQKVIDYVVQKYTQQQVAHIVAYGTMGTKSSIKDVARVLELPLSEANQIVKLVPEKPAYRMNFEKLLHTPLTGEKSLTKLGLSHDELENVKQIRKLYDGKTLTAEVLHEAEKLEGTARNTSIHAAGIIIAPKDITEIMPVLTVKDINLYVTQFEGDTIEESGVIKMDFLGLRNLTIIKDALHLIEKNHSLKIDIDEIPLDDPKTYELFQKAETNGVFQFESDGMKKYLKDLKPDRFNDLIAMNALFRPGPMAYIPNYVNRKQGTEKIEYDFPEMEEYLADTYGITVYQEQVMLLSQKLANFTKGDADTLRKAMGKKQREVLDKMKSKFLDGCKINNHNLKIAEKVWSDWEAFAEYAFNKSHSTCYSYVAYQTAYLKAHYPAEYMAAVLNSVSGNIERITFFMEECKRMGLNVLYPSINESQKRFSVTKKGVIRFGLGGIKGAGDAAVASIIEERETNGAFKDVYDFMKRINLRTVNKKTLESLVASGSFDDFGIFRAQYLNENEGLSFIERLIRFANREQESKHTNQASLFGEMAKTENNFSLLGFPKPEAILEWGGLEKLKNEKEVIGMFVSGHPLEEYSIEIQHFCTDTLDNIMALTEKEVKIGGIVTKVQKRISKSGNPFLTFSIEDFKGSLEITLFDKDYTKFAHFIEEDRFLFLVGDIQKRWKSSSEYEFMPKNISFLSEIRTHANHLKIKIPLEKINENFIETTKKWLQNTQNGNCEVSFYINNSIEIELGAPKNINPTNETLQFLDEEELLYKIDI